MISWLLILAVGLICVIAFAILMWLSLTADRQRNDDFWRD